MMSALRMTSHGRARMRQRGFAADDLDLLLQIGVEVPDGYLCTRKASAELIGHLKRLIGRLERLPGKRAVVRGDALVTAYHCTDTQRRQLAQRAEQRELSR